MHLRSPSAAVFLFAATIAIAVVSACDTDTAPNELPNGSVHDGGGTDPTKDSGSSSSSSGGDAAGDAKPIVVGDGGPSTLRIVAANISSGTASTYDSGEGIRIFQGIHPDIALIQEWNYGTGSDVDIKKFVTDAFGAQYSYYRETGLGAGAIPNGVISRYPIALSGRWADPQVTNRGFAWAKITVPNDTHPLWAVSVHLLTSGGANRATEATNLLTELNKVVQAGDYIAIGGDFNTDTRVEDCITTLGAVVSTQGPYPVDQAGSDLTSGPRSRPYDWVLTSPSLTTHQVPTVIGQNSFPSGLVFDSRVYTPLADVAPVLINDCGAVNMQHMAVVRDFTVP